MKNIVEMSESEHERAFKEYAAENFSNPTLKKCMNAVKELRENGKDWEWLHYALFKKSAAKYEEFGFGLWFNRSFNGSVRDAITRDKKLATISDSDVAEWLWSTPRESESKEEVKTAPFYEEKNKEYNIDNESKSLMNTGIDIHSTSENEQVTSQGSRQVLGYRHPDSFRF